MGCEEDSFIVYNLLDCPNPIYLSDSSVLNTYGTGKICTKDKLNLFNVLHFLNLNVNLLSVDKVLQQDFNVVFSGDDCTIKKGYKNIIEAFRINNLFHVDGKARKRTILYSNALSPPVSVTPQPADSLPDLPALPPPAVGARALVLWHQRLGHLNYYLPRRLCSLADGIPITDSQKSVDLVVCPRCLIGKHHQTYQRWIPAACTDSPLSLVYSNTCGPFRTPAVIGAKHLIFFIDDNTRITWDYF